MLLLTRTISAPLFLTLNFQVYLLGYTVLVPIALSLISSSVNIYFPFSHPDVSMLGGVSCIAYFNIKLLLCQLPVPVFTNCQAEADFRQQNSYYQVARPVSSMGSSRYTGPRTSTFQWRDKRVVRHRARRRLSEPVARRQGGELRSRRQEAEPSPPGAAMRSPAYGM